MQKNGRKERNRLSDDRNDEDNKDNDKGKKGMKKETPWGRDELGNADCKLPG